MVCPILNVVCTNVFYSIYIEGQNSIAIVFFIYIEKSPYA